MAMTKIISGETMLEQIRRENLLAAAEHERKKQLALARIRLLRNEQKLAEALLKNETR